MPNNYWSPSAGSGGTRGATAQKKDLPQGKKSFFVGGVILCQQGSGLEPTARQTRACPPVKPVHCTGCTCQSNLSGRGTPHHPQSHGHPGKPRDGSSPVQRLLAIASQKYLHSSPHVYQQVTQIQHHQHPAVPKSTQPSQAFHGADWGIAPHEPQNSGRQRSDFAGTRANTNLLPETRIGNNGAPRCGPACVQS